MKLNIVFGDNEKGVNVRPAELALAIETLVCEDSDEYGFAEENTAYLQAIAETLQSIINYRLRKELQSQLQGVSHD